MRNYNPSIDITLAFVCVPDSPLAVGPAIGAPYSVGPAVLLDASPSAIRKIFRVS